MLQTHAGKVVQGFALNCKTIYFVFSLNYISTCPYENSLVLETHASKLVQVFALNSVIIYFFLSIIISTCPYERQCKDRHQSVENVFVYKLYQLKTIEHS